MSIHPSAVIDPRAKIGSGVEIGPFCVIGAEVEIGAACVLRSHVIVNGRTTIDHGTQVFDGVALGNEAQHARAAERPGRLEIGANAILREHVTVHVGLTEDAVTRIGEAAFIMAGAHVAHDCEVGAHVVMANHVLLGGHVHVGEAAFLSGAVAVHQFCRIGQQAMVGGQAHVTQDVLPFVTVDGRSGLVVGLNVVGLRRAGTPAAEIQRIKEAYRIVFRSGLMANEIRQQLQGTGNPYATQYAAFIAASERGFLRERQMPRSATIQLRQDTGSESQVASSEIRRVG